METSKPKKIIVGSSVAKAAFREPENPEAIEKVVKGRVLWGKNNLYGQELVAYREDNPMHGGIINQKVIYMSSAGADITGLDGLEDELEGMLPEIVDDFETFNGFAILFLKSGESWQIKKIDFESVRILADENAFEMSDDWSAKSQSLEKTNYRVIKDLAFATLTGEDADTELLFYCKVKPKQRKLKDGKLSLCNYPVPGYIGAKTSILAGIEQDYFTYSESVNGYKGGTIISLNNGTPEDDKKADEIADRIKEDATDRDKQGGITVLFSDGADNAATVMSMNGNDLDKRYLESNKEIRDKIMVGHSVVSPTLFAVGGTGIFGSKEEMEVAYTLFSSNYVAGRQKFIADGIVWAFKRLGIKTASIQFRQYSLPFIPKVDDDGETLKQLNSMSPLVATKVLDSMTEDEIRRLAKLPPKAEQMSQEKRDNILSRLATLGVLRKDSKVLASRSFNFEDSDESFISSYSGFAEITQTQQLILQMIKDEKTFSEISKAIGKGALSLSLEILKLNAKGLLKGWTVINADAIDLEVRYSYEVKKGLGNSVIETTRDFCRQLIELDRLYTRAEIDTLSNETGTDVWRYRGGWYTNPKTGVTTPSCRHEWKQNIVRK